MTTPIEVRPQSSELIRYQPPVYHPAAVNPGVDRAAGEEDSGSNLLAVAWQSRWLLVLFTLLGGSVAWSYLERVEPRYTSTARIYVEQQLPKLIAGEVGLGRFASQLNTQVALITSTPVVTAAADYPELESLRTFAGVDNRGGVIRNALRVHVGKDDIINVSVELPNADDAAQIANAVVDAYIAKYAERRSTDVAEVLDILRKEKRRRDEELEDRREALVDFRANHTALAVQTASSDNVVTQLFSALSGELNHSQIRLLEAKGRYNRAKSMLEEPSQLPFLLELARSSHSGMGVSQLEQQIQSTEQQLIAERTKWGDGYPSVRLLKDSLEVLRERRKTQQVEVVQAYVENLRQDFELQIQKRDELQKAYDKQYELATEVSGQAAELATLQEAYERTAKLCDILDERIRDVNLSDEVGAMNVDIVEVAAGSYQSYPDRPKILSMGLAFGAMVGFGLAWLRDFLDHRMKSIDEIASTLQVPVVGTIPVVSDGRGLEDSDKGRAVAVQPRSFYAEAVRSLRTALTFGISNADVKTFVVTSAASGDGKSMLASNLAIAMAQADRKVLLIDADMRKPGQHQAFGVTRDPGLPAVLAGSVTPPEAIVPSGIPSLDLLPCGKRPANPVELLSGGRFAELLTELGAEYDQIIIDSPPVLAVADARLISAVVDCSLLVVRAEKSVRRVCVAARDELLKIQTRRLGVVVNAAPMRRAGYGYGVGLGQDYRAYGDGPYGATDDDQDDFADVASTKPSAALSGEVLPPSGS